MAYNQSDQFFEQSTDTDGNFGNSVSGQTNSFFLPKVYSKQVLNFFRKSSVAEAITNICTQQPVKELLVSKGKRELSKYPSISERFSQEILFIREFNK